VLLLLGPVAGVSAEVRATPATSSSSWPQATYDAIVQQVAATKPTFPARECNVLDQSYASLIRQVVDGAGTSKPRTVWYYGDAINAAISDCHNAGGGTVVVPASGSRNANGIYYSGAITLLSNVDLDVATGATIRFVRNPTNAYYPLVPTSWAGSDFYSFSPPIDALNQTNIGLSGGGTLDAQYNVSAWKFPSSSDAPAGDWVALLALNRAGVPVDQRLFTADGKLPSTIPVLQNCPAQQQDWGPCGSVQDVAPPAGTTAYQGMLAPPFIEFNHCANVLVQGLTLINTQLMHVHPLNSENVSIYNLTIKDSAHYQDGGIIVESSRYVVISNNHITTLDDGVPVQSGYDRDGRELRAPSEDIIVENNTFTNPGKASRAASVAIGSDASAGASDVFAQKNVVGGTGLGYLLRLKTNSYRGGEIKNIYLRNSTIRSATAGALGFDSAYGEVAPPPHADVFNPAIRGVYIDHVTGKGAPRSVPLLTAATVSRSPVADVVIKNSIFHTTTRLQKSFSLPGSSFFSNLTIHDVTVVNPRTGHRVVNTSAPLGLVKPAVAHTAEGSVRLHDDAGCTTCSSPRQLPSRTFTLTGKVARYRRLKPTIEVFVDRDPQPIRVRVRRDGSFRAARVTLDNTPYWYQGVHYVSINLHRGIDVQTIVYLVAAS
jgi:polygalacturonase